MEDLLLVEHLSSLFKFNGVEKMRALISVALNELGLILNPCIGQVCADCWILAIVDVLQSLPLSLEDSHSGCVHNSIPVRVELLPILLKIERWLAMSDHVSIHMPDAKAAVPRYVY